MQEATQVIAKDMEESAEWRKGTAKLNRTVCALLSRGIDSRTATALQKEGWTVAKLKQRKLDELINLGIPVPAAQNITAEERPPIPFDVLAKVVIASRMTCCVCRREDRGIIVHHIKTWAESHDHSASNLAVLCLDDHDKAHKRGGHTQNLTSKLIYASKQFWEVEVAKLDTRAILAASAIDSDCWWLFNHTRLFALAQDMHIKLPNMASYPTAVRLGLADISGCLCERNSQQHYMYYGESGSALYMYVKDVLNEVLKELTVINISDVLDRGSLRAVLRAGNFISLQGAYSFASQTNNRTGSGQTIRGIRKANGISVSFTVDRWDATSTSAWGMWLTRRQEAMCLLRVINVSRGKNRLNIETSALAISAALEGLKDREYSNVPFRRGLVNYPDDEQDAEPLSALNDAADQADEDAD